MNYSPDQIIYWKHGFFEINSTILFSWIVMAVLIVSALILRKMLTTGGDISPLQSFFEAVIGTIGNQLKLIGVANATSVFPYVATIFCFVIVSNLLGIIPGFRSPTASLSTTAGLSLSALVMKHIFGIKSRGFKKYMKKYFEPIFAMFPINFIGDFSGNVSMAVRLYGNMMSSGVIMMVLSQITFMAIGLPIFINLLGCITCVVQAYIFSVLATIDIAQAEAKD